MVLELVFPQLPYFKGFSFIKWLSASLNNSTHKSKGSHGGERSIKSGGAPTYPTIRKADGEVISRVNGTPQGGVISPLLANLFLHYAFDKWMLQNHPNSVFARYADDIVIHCKTESEAEAVMHSVKERLGECNLTMHPTKTRIIYCKDDRRKEKHANQKFTFLGYEFRPRKCRTGNGENFTGFTPAVSGEAKKCMSKRMRQWRIHLKSHQTIQEIAQSINPI